MAEGECTFLQDTTDPSLNNLAYFSSHAPEMLLQQARPTASLARWIHSFRQYRFAPGDTAPLIGLPGTGAELWLCEAPPTAGNPASLGDGVWAPRSRCFSFRPDGLLIFAIRFRAGALPFFTDRALSDLVDRYSPLEALWDERATRPLTGLHGSPHFEEQCLQAERFLHAQLRVGRALERSQALANAIFEHSADFALADYAEQIHCDRSHLSRQFHAVCGTSAKYFHRLCRFERFLRDALFSSDASLAGLAVEHGYFDQAHMSNEVRELTRQSPRALLACKETRVFYAQRLDPGGLQAPKTSSPLR